MKELYVISGATGMTGSQLVKQLLQTECEIIAFDNFFASDIESIAECLQNIKLKFYEYDINNADHMQKIKAEIVMAAKAAVKIIFINCAAVVHTEHFYEVNSTFNTNVLGMKLFLEMAIAVKANIFINCSTSEVYSMQSYQEGGVKESDYLLLATAEESQRTSYATGKLLTEFFMKDAVDKGYIKGCSIRFANVYSDFELYPKHIIPHIINGLMSDKKVTLLENAKKTYRTFLHNIDSCNGVLALINSETALDGGVYNVATTEEISILDLVKVLADKLEIKDYKVEFSGVRKSDPTRRYLCVDKIMQRTAWKPLISLDIGLSMCTEKARGKK